MASSFDPSAFIEAERRETVATIAGGHADCDRTRREEKARISARPTPFPSKESQQSQQSQLSEAEISIWIAGPKLMTAMPRPLLMKDGEWNYLVRLAKWVSDDWAEAAVAQSWHPLEFFGCNPDPFVGRRDRDGLIHTLFRLRSPVEITSIHPDHVELRTRQGDVLRYRPFGSRRQAYLWEAYAMKAGP